MDSDEYEVFNFLKTFAQEWVNAKEICRRAGTKRRFHEDNNWAMPVLMRLKERQILETDIQGRYRIRPASRKDQKNRWVSPDIEKILEEGGIRVNAEETETPPEED